MDFYAPFMELQNQDPYVVKGNFLLFYINKFLLKLLERLVSLRIDHDVQSFHSFVVFVRPVRGYVTTKSDFVQNWPSSVNGI